MAASVCRKMPCNIRADMVLRSVREFASWRRRVSADEIGHQGARSADGNRQAPGTLFSHINHRLKFDDSFGFSDLSDWEEAGASHNKSLRGNRFGPGVRGRVRIHGPIPFAWCTSSRGPNPASDQLPANRADSACRRSAFERTMDHRSGPCADFVSGSANLIRARVFRDGHRTT